MDESYGSLEFWEREHRRRAELGRTPADEEWERAEQANVDKPHGGGAEEEITRRVLAPKKRKERRAKEREWYGEPEEIMEIFEMFFKEDSEAEPILQLGCGVSKLAEAFWRRGRTNLTCVDQSSTAIEHAKVRDANLHGVQYMCMDCEDLRAFPDASFMYVVDKGFLDAVFASLGGVRKVGRVLEEISRVLKPGGMYIFISNAPRHCRFPHLMRPRFDWAVDSVGVPIDPGYSAYACQKRSFHLEWFFPDPGALHCARQAEIPYRLPIR